VELVDRRGGWTGDGVFGGGEEELEFMDVRVGRLVVVLISEEERTFGEEVLQFGQEGLFPLRLI
jgi:hypothetical protein